MLYFGTNFTSCHEFFISKILEVKKSSGSKLCKVSSIGVGLRWSHKGKGESASDRAWRTLAYVLYGQGQSCGCFIRLGKVRLDQSCPTHSPLTKCGEWLFKFGEWKFSICILFLTKSYELAQDFDLNFIKTGLLLCDKIQ